eukprot:1149150-Pelagomonas_calceolata.AAC.4
MLPLQLGAWCSINCTSRFAKSRLGGSKMVLVEEFHNCFGFHDDDGDESDGGGGHALWLVHAEDSEEMEDDKLAPGSG